MAAQDTKVCLLGQTQVGKTSLVRRFVTDTFTPGSETTLGASFLSKTVLVDKRSIKFQIWDTAGQERFRGLAPMYYRGAAAAILVYDITDKKSFSSLKTWREELKTNGPEEIIIAIVGNKQDLNEERVVSTEEGKEYADSVEALFFETSSKSNVNIQLLFETIARHLPEVQVKTEGKLDFAQPVNSERKCEC